MKIVPQKELIGRVVRGIIERDRRKRIKYRAPFPYLSSGIGIVPLLIAFYLSASQVSGSHFV